MAHIIIFRRSVPQFSFINHNFEGQFRDSTWASNGKFDFRDKYHGKKLRVKVTDSIDDVRGEIPPHCLIAMMYVDKDNDEVTKSTISKILSSTHIDTKIAVVLLASERGDHIRMESLKDQIVEMQPRLKLIWLLPQMDKIAIWNLLYDTTRDYVVRDIPRRASQREYEASTSYAISQKFRGIGEAFMKVLGRGRVPEESLLPQNNNNPQDVESQAFGESVTEEKIHRPQVVFLPPTSQPDFSRRRYCM